VVIDGVVEKRVAASCGGVPVVVLDCLGSTQGAVSTTMGIRPSFLMSTCTSSPGRALS